MNQPEKAESDELVLIGVIIKPHGLLGEVKVKPLTDFPSRFQELKRVFLLPKEGESYPLTVTWANVLPKMILVRFAEINDINAAEKLVGCEMAVPRGEGVQLPSDSDYLFELIGMRVVLSHCDSVGTVVDVQSSPAQYLLIVNTTDQRQVLVPFVNEIVTAVSLETRQITVVDLPGLFE